MLVNIDINLHWNSRVYFKIEIIWHIRNASASDKSISININAILININ